MSWAGVGTGSKTSDLRQTSKCFPRSSLIREYFRIVNGGFSTNRIVVKTHLLCTAELFETTVQTLTKLITDAMVAPIFPTPSTAKWTKTGPCNDRFIFCSCNSILPELTEREVCQSYSLRSSLSLRTMPRSLIQHRSTGRGSLTNNPRSH